MDFQPESLGSVGLLFVNQVGEVVQSAVTDFLLDDFLRRFAQFGGQVLLYRSRPRAVICLEGFLGLATHCSVLLTYLACLSTFEQKDAAEKLLFVEVRPLTHIDVRWYHV